MAYAEPRFARLTTDPSIDRGRIASCVGVAIVHLLLGFFILSGLRVSLPARLADSLKAFTVLPPPPPPVEKAQPQRPKSARREGAASPPNLRAKPTEIVAPPVIRIVEQPQHIIAATKAGPGFDPSAGAADVRGPGSGSGGQGNGTGSGEKGSGDGDGGTPLHWLSGRIKDSDTPRSVRDTDFEGTVFLRFTVGVKGRVTDCVVTRSSGNRDVDETTCRLIVQRFRYKPTTDAAGKPVPDVVTGQHEWNVLRPPGDNE